MECCGWTSPGNWSENILIKNSSQNLYPCSCRNESLPGTDIKHVGLCEHLSAGTPIYQMGCMTSVEKWLLENCGVILGICVGVAVVELLGMILSMCLCKSVFQEDYTKVPKYWAEDGASYTPHTDGWTLFVSLSLSHILKNTLTHTQIETAVASIWASPALTAVQISHAPYVPHTQTHTHLSIKLGGSKSTSYRCCVIILFFLRRHLWCYCNFSFLNVHICVVLFSWADLNEVLNIVVESTLVTFGELRAGESSDSGAWRWERDKRVRVGAW